MTLHITNGDSAVATLKNAGIAGDYLPWRDVLHDGPAPANLTLEKMSTVRAKFIAECGWGEEHDVLEDFRRRDATLSSYHDYEEVILWFEHDLYDQLQLLQLLDWFSSRDLTGTRLCLINEDEYIAETASKKLN